MKIYNYVVSSVEDSIIAHTRNPSYNHVLRSTSNGLQGWISRDIYAPVSIIPFVALQSVYDCVDLLK